MPEFSLEEPLTFPFCTISTGHKFRVNRPVLDNLAPATLQELQRSAKEIRLLAGAERDYIFWTTFPDWKNEGKIWNICRINIYLY